MPIYRKKPVEIEAVRWNGTASQATSIIDWVLGNDGTAIFVDGGITDDGTVVDARITIVTLEGTTHAQPGDWVLRGAFGEFYPVKPHIFADTYEWVSHEWAAK